MRFSVKKDYPGAEPGAGAISLRQYMGKQLSEHFNFDELTDSKDNPDLVKTNREEALKYEDSLKKVANELLEPIRKNYNVSIRVNSGFRGKTLNQKVGGSLTSQHCLGEAADFNVKGYETREKQIDVVKWIRDNFNKSGYKWGQLLLERGCIHLSLGTKCEIAEYDVPTKTKKLIKELENK